MEKDVMATTLVLLILKVQGSFCSTELMQTMQSCFGSSRFLHSSALTKYTFFFIHLPIIHACPPNKQETHGFKAPTAYNYHSVWSQLSLAHRVLIEVTLSEPEQCVEQRATCRHQNHFVFLPCSTFHSCVSW